MEDSLDPYGSDEKELPVRSEIRESAGDKQF